LKANELAPAKAGANSFAFNYFWRLILLSNVTQGGAARLNICRKPQVKLPKVQRTLKEFVLG